MVAEIAQRMPHREFSVTLKINVDKGGGNEWDPPVNASGGLLGEVVNQWATNGEGHIAPRQGYIFVAHRDANFLLSNLPGIQSFVGYSYTISNSIASPNGHSAPSLTLPPQWPTQSPYGHLTVFQVNAQQTIPNALLNAASNAAQNASSYRIWAQF